MGVIAGRLGRRKAEEPTQGVVSCLTRSRQAPQIAKNAFVDADFHPALPIYGTSRFTHGHPPCDLCVALVSRSFTLRRDGEPRGGRPSPWTHREPEPRRHE